MVNSLTGPTRKGRKIVYSGDTTYTRNVVELAEGADVLIHEANVSRRRRSACAARIHATAVMARKPPSRREYER